MRQLHETTARFGWSRNVLLNQIKAQAYERSLAEGKSHNFPTALPEHLAEQAEEALKSSYNLEFLGIRQQVKERELEDRSIDRLRDFILELGYGFCFIGRQHRVTLGRNEYFIDLLFYHRVLKALVAVELKVGKFEPEYAGKMDSYLNLLNEKERAPDDAPSIGIILCAEKDNLEVEFALKSKTNPIGVAEFALAQARLSPGRVHHCQPDRHRSTRFAIQTRPAQDGPVAHQVKREAGRPERGGTNHAMHRPGRHQEWHPHADQGRRQNEYVARDVEAVRAERPTGVAARRARHHADDKPAGGANRQRMRGHGAADPAELRCSPQRQVQRDPRIRGMQHPHQRRAPGLPWLPQGPAQPMGACAKQRQGSQRHTVQTQEVGSQQGKHRSEGGFLEHRVTHGARARHTVVGEHRNDAPSHHRHDEQHHVEPDLHAQPCGQIQDAEL